MCSSTYTPLQYCSQSHRDNGERGCSSKEEESPTAQLEWSDAIEHENGGGAALTWSRSLTHIDEQCKKSLKKKKKTETRKLGKKEEGGSVTSDELS